ncbi:MAG: type IV toxin-antitoxin system AbiEi family antitoxin domain-containing protein [Clostridia bacterium]|nr:type IV toxin-antitoxin system AbiEi family antitoxin domain-containing protein [Clostridia bacterium]
MFDQYGGVMRTKDLRDHGFYDRKVKALIKEGLVVQIRRGYYQYIGDENFTEAAVIVKLFPDGVLCMDSALDYYGYTDRTPSAWHIAVDSKSSRERFRIEYPIVKPHFTDSSRFGIGVSEGEINGVAIRIYDRERTVCDCLRNRNKMDAEVFNEMVRSYVNDPGKDAANLAKYAMALHVEKKVRDGLGSWL